MSRFTFANSSNPDKVPPYVAFYLGLTVCQSTCVPVPRIKKSKVLLTSQASILKRVIKKFSSFSTKTYVEGIQKKHLCFFMSTPKHMFQLTAKKIITFYSQKVCLTFYLKEAPFNTFANRVDSDKAALVRAASLGPTLFATGNMIRYDPT